MGKCRFAKNCKLFDSKSRTCTKDYGDYYGPCRMGGCGRDFEQRGRKATYYKKREKPLTFLEKFKKKVGIEVFD